MNASPRAAGTACSWQGCCSGCRPGVRRPASRPARQDRKQGASGPKGEGAAASGDAPEERAKGDGGACQVDGGDAGGRRRFSTKALLCAGPCWLCLGRPTARGKPLRWGGHGATRQHTHTHTHTQSHTLAHCHTHSHTAHCHTHSHTRTLAALDLSLNRQKINPKKWGKKKKKKTDPTSSVCSGDLPLLRMQIATRRASCAFRKTPLLLLRQTTTLAPAPAPAIVSARLRATQSLRPLQLLPVTRRKLASATSNGAMYPPIEPYQQGMLKVGTASLSPLLRPDTHPHAHTHTHRCIVLFFPPRSPSSTPCTGSRAATPTGNPSSSCMVAREVKPPIDVLDLPLPFPPTIRTAGEMAPWIR
jgi:hypothetical protein